MAAPLSLRSVAAPEGWDTVATDLRVDGVAVVKLSSLVAESSEADPSEIVRAAFAAVQAAWPALAADPRLRLPPASGAAHATGFHGPGGNAEPSLSRYNQFREGLVLSDGATLGDLMAEQRLIAEASLQGAPDYESLEAPLAALEELLHAVSEEMCHAIERDLELPEDWFSSAMGTTRTSSQWHLKRYVTARAPKEDGDDAESSSLIRDWLPLHTDPSLLSVVVHDRPGVQSGAQGLWYSSNTGGSAEVSWSGHGVAIVLVGSVLNLLTGGRYPACRHWVAAPDASALHQHSRTAATLFLRPARAAPLAVPPSPRLTHVASLKHASTFEDWNHRVARNYARGRRRGGSGAAKSRRAMTAKGVGAKSIATEGSRD